ncbi:MAG: FAD-dependent oxidoreductase [Myxococcaceae bacterium]
MAPGDAAGPSSWGRYPHVVQRSHALAWASDPLPVGSEPLLPYGLGRSYGDVCLNPDGPVLLTRGLRRFVSFDAESGVLRCEAGCTLGEVAELTLPKGWFPPVVPGTRFITVGGAVANDVHGKNHHRAGTFGRHVRALELLRSDGTRVVCGPSANAQLFRATVGGLGLTGLMTWVELQLASVPGPWMEVEAVPFSTLEGFAELAAASDKTHAYTVAWVDGLARGKASGRGIFFRGNHAAASGVLPAPRTWLSVPFDAPDALLSAPLLRAFNFLYRHWPRGGARRVSLWKFLHPLDAMGDWNRLYGSRGLLQHQSVVPGPAGVAALLATASSSGQGSFLTVLKTFSDVPSPGLLSFPRPGWTLALDFPGRGEATLALLEKLDAVVLAHGGRVYPAKDARMAKDTFRAGYPEWKAFAAHVDPRFSSGFWRRVGGEA